MSAITLKLQLLLHKNKTKLWEHLKQLLGVLGILGYFQQTKKKKKSLDLLS